MNEFHGVRAAKPEDVPQIFKLLLPMHEENGLCLLDPPKAYQSIMDLLDPYHGVVGVIDGDDGIEGSVGMILTSWYYSRDMHFTEMWNFVRPDKRKSTHAKKLIEFAKWCADTLGIPLYMGIVSTDRVEAKQRLYRRQLTPIGATFIHGSPSLKGEQLFAIAEKNKETDKLLDGYHSAIKRLMVSKDKPKNKRQREEMVVAMNGLETAYNRAKAVLEGQPHEGLNGGNSQEQHINTVIEA